MLYCLEKLTPLSGSYCAIGVASLGVLTYFGLISKGLFLAAMLSLSKDCSS